MIKFKYFISLILSLVFSSCLKVNLEDLPLYDAADIVDVKFDFRYKDMSDKWIDGEPIVKVVSLLVENKTIDNEAGIIKCSIRVPDITTSFTEDIRGTVSLKNIVGKFNISTAAIIRPLDGSPVLGSPGDFSKPCKYRVKAANGFEKDWIIEIIELKK